jgi:hypothetical protein
MGAPGLGNFGGQLTAEELRAALAAAGGSPDALDFGAPSLPPQAAPAPAAEPPPPAVEQAPAEPPAAPEPPPDMSVQRASGGPQRAIREYQDENLADANKRIEIAGRSGDSTGQDATSYNAQAEIRGRQASQSKANADDARGRVDERREHEARYQQEADRIYEDMKAHAQPPPQSTVSKVLGIVGAVAGMGGRGGAAQGIGMLSSMLGGDQERWAAEQAANSQLYQAALKNVGADRDGAASDIAIAQGLTALEAHEIDASLEQIKAMGLSRNATRTAEDLQLKFRGEVRNGLIGMEQAKANAAAARGDMAQRDALMRMDIPTLRAMEAGPSGLSELGQQILADKIKKDQADKGGYADIRKKEAELAAGPGGGKMTDGERKIDMVVQGIAGADGPYARMAQLVSKAGGDPNKIDMPRFGVGGVTGYLPSQVVPEENLQQDADLNALVGSVLRAESGASISKEEVENKRRALGLDSSDESVRAKGLTTLLQQVKAIDLQGRLGAVDEAAQKKGYNFKPRSGPANRSPQALARELLERNEGFGSGGA